MTDPDAEPTGCWWCWWQKPTKVDCSKKPNNNCTECKSICDCEYANAVADCDGKMCKDNALVDRNACYGNCLHDHVDCTDTW